jgi:hypothetical protein
VVIYRRYTGARQNDFTAGGYAQGTDVVSLVSMSNASPKSTEAELIFERKPLDWLLYNELLCLRQTVVPRCHGNYLPALDEANRLLSGTSHSDCALSLMFLSDGKPSDTIAGGLGTPRQKHVAMATERTAQLASRFGRRLSLATIGLAGGSEDFAVLEAMADTARQYQVQATFHRVEMAEHGLSSGALATAVLTLSSSLTGTRTEMTAIGGASQRKIRNATREASGAHDGMHVTSDWMHCQDVLRIRKWSVEAKAVVNVDLDLGVLAPGGVAIKWNHAQNWPHIFGEGAERMVSKFRLVGEVSAYRTYPSFVGEKLVAKMSRFDESGDSVKCASVLHRSKCGSAVLQHCGSASYAASPG